ncbi:cysteine-rich VLP protein [Sulfobacillus sp. hq2]|uniref:cysteine-rich VLP protein n=1 Tax=Sulfobacillus TaxID=28033 RepID=UPI000CD0560B|nr:hypothetical protein CO251_14760 [Sulfobacillus sp. hq2]
MLSEKVRHQNIRRTVQADCANFVGGRCLESEQACSLLTWTKGQDSYACQYFEEAVLPANPVLRAEYQQSSKTPDNKQMVQTGQCQSCRTSFVKTGRNQRYCPPCGRQAHRKAQASASRAYRRRKAKPS